MNEVKVSIICYAYNHEPYIRRCLDGFLMQKTDFAFEVIIHDDASTDHTADIIREYAQQYPEIIKPILQTENQYSKGIDFETKYMHPIARGEYFAYCEGDDCWIDEHKLQIQVSFLDAHPDYSMCLHRIKVYNVPEKSVSVRPEREKEADFTLEDFILSGIPTQTSSFMVRRTVAELPSCFIIKESGDWSLCMYAAICGKVHMLSDIMSQFNDHSSAVSFQQRVWDNPEKYISYQRSKIAAYEKINEYYDYRYDEAFSQAILKLKFQICLRTDLKSARKEPFVQLYQALPVRSKIGYRFPRASRFYHSLRASLRKAKNSK